MKNNLKVFQVLSLIAEPPGILKVSSGQEAKAIKFQEVDDSYLPVNEDYRNTIQGNSE